MRTCGKIFFEFCVLCPLYSIDDFNLVERWISIVMSFMGLEGNKNRNSENLRQFGCQKF